MSACLSALVVDDQFLARDGIARLIREARPDADVVTAATASAALDACSARRFDLLLLDLNLPDRSGLQLLSQLRMHYAELFICVISANSEPAVVGRCRDVGASAFISKTGDGAGFQRSLRQVLHGEPVFCAEPIGTPRPQENRAAASGNTFRLTPREQDVMTWLAKGYSNKKIARELGMLPDTVKVHVSGILRKLHVQSRGEAIAVFGQAASVAAPAAAPNPSWLERSLAPGAGRHSVSLGSEASFAGSLA